MNKIWVLICLLIIGCKSTPNVPIKTTPSAVIDPHRMECTINTPSCRCRSKSGGGTECR